MAKIMVLSIKIGMLYGRQGKIIFPLKWLEMALAQLRSFPAIFANIWIVPYFCILNFLHQNLECGDGPDKFCLRAYFDLRLVHFCHLEPKLEICKNMAQCVGHMKYTCLVSGTMSIEFLVKFYPILM